jgi:hypothetical protein
VGVLIFEREIWQQSGVHHEGVVLGELEPEREGGKPLPILVFELIGDPLMGGLELGKVVTGALGIPPPQAMLIVVATHRERRPPARAE